MIIRRLMTINHEVLLENSCLTNCLTNVLKIDKYYKISINEKF